MAVRKQRMANFEYVSWIGAGISESLRRRIGLRVIRHCAVFPIFYRQPKLYCSWHVNVIKLLSFDGCQHDFGKHYYGKLTSCVVIVVLFSQNSKLQWLLWNCNMYSKKATSDVSDKVRATSFTTRTT